MLVGNRIEQLANERNITKTEILNKTGLSKATLYNIINNIGSPSCENLEKIADFFDVSMDFFFKRESSKGINIGHTVTGNGNSVNGNIELTECQTEVRHLKELLQEKERLIKVLMKDV